MHAIITNQADGERGRTQEHDIITSIHEMARCILCLPHM
jgi:hypothetical protein